MKDTKNKKITIIFEKAITKFNGKLEAKITVKLPCNAEGSILQEIQNEYLHIFDQKIINDSFTIERENHTRNLYRIRYFPISIAGFKDAKDFLDDQKEIVIGTLTITYHNYLKIKDSKEIESYLI